MGEKIKAMETEININNAEKDGLRKKIEGMEQALQVREKQLTTSAQQLSQLTAELDEARADKESLEKHLRVVEDENSSLKKERESSDAKGKKEIADLKKKTEREQELKDLLLQMKKKNGVLLEDKRRLKLELSKQKSSSTEMNDKLSKTLQMKTAALESKVVKLKNTIATMKTEFNEESEVQRCK